MDVPFSSIAIVGFGLIGASLALAVKRRSPAVRIIALDREAVLASDAVQEMVRQGVVDSRVLADSPDAMIAAVKQAELTCLATPVRIIEQHLPLLLPHAQLITDCGSTKREIVQQALGSPHVERFVPGHPMAGRPRGGAESASAELFEQRTWILCPGVGSQQNLERVAQLVELVGATRVDMQPDAHDLAVAVTSHVPQLFASLLAVIANEAGAEPAAGPGFQSATRVAGGNLSMWRDIFLSNADAISQVAEQLAGSLQKIATEFGAGRVDEALRVLEKAQEVRGQR